MYMLQGREASLFPRSAAGVVASAVRRHLRGPRNHQGHGLPDEVPAAGEGAAQESPHYYYGQYYAAQAMWQAGGERWAKWYPAVRDDLLARASPTAPGSRPTRADYATAMA